MTGRLGRLLLILAAIGLVAAPALAGPCLHTGVKALVAATDGKPVNPAAARGCRPADLDNPPPGSGNWPILHSAALYAAGHEDSRWVRPWLEGAGSWGHNGRESGSTIYEGVNTASAILVCHAACYRRGDPQTCAAASDYLKAAIAKWALAATSNGAKWIDYRQGKVHVRRARINYLGQSGPFTHLPGNRQGENPGRGNAMGTWVDVHPMGALIAWAGDVPGRRYVESRILPTDASLPLWVASRIAKVGYRQRLPSLTVGLSQREQRTLGAYLANPTSTTHAAELASWLSLRPNRPNITLTYRRYKSGDFVGVLSSTSNANKPGATVVASIGRTSHWRIASTYKGVGAATGFGRLEQDRAIAKSNDGGEHVLDLSGLGPVAWTVIYDESGARLAGAPSPPPPPVGGGQVAGGAPPPPPSPGAATPTLRSDYVAALGQIQRLMGAPGTTPEARTLLATWGEVLRRLGHAEALQGDARAGALASAAQGAQTFAAKARPPG